MRTWMKLHQEIRRFYFTGMLYPVVNKVLADGDHYCNRNIDPIRILPLKLYDRIIELSREQKRKMVPNTGGRYLIKSKSPNRKQAWKSDTEFMRRKYDKWYWDMRLQRTPYTVALRAPMKKMTSNIQRKVHFYHVDAAVERNRTLPWPPRWLEEIYLG